MQYAKTRNFGNGAVTYLSPYISRGVISTRQVFEYIITLDLTWQESEKLIQELAWRDYWQQVWIAKGDGINTDLKNTQEPLSNHRVPSAVVNASTGIEAIDDGIKELYETGYMHNHMRMYVASVCCNVAHSHWLEPARWLYAHLLDGDLASNQLSWQWVAGAFSNKKYYANQANINKFFNSTQQNTFLDIDYNDFSKLNTPHILSETITFDLQTPLPNIDRPMLKQHQTTLIYNYYNLDPYWHQGEDLQRILLLEPAVFNKNPVSQKCIDFVMELKENIPGIKVFVGEFNDLLNQLNPEKIVYKEHPLNKHYKGHEEPREWLGSITGYYPSFFAFWKKLKKELRS
jgi:deoxyribodipyrimidine photo-lyase